MWINDEVLYTPEEVTITQGLALVSRVKSVGVDGTTLLIMLPDGKEERVEARLCKPVITN